MLGLEPFMTMIFFTRELSDFVCFFKIAVRLAAALPYFLYGVVMPSFKTFTQEQIDTTALLEPALERLLRSVDLNEQLLTGFASTESASRQQPSRPQNKLAAKVSVWIPQARVG